MAEQSDGKASEWLGKNWNLKADRKYEEGKQRWYLNSGLLYMRACERHGPASVTEDNLVVIGQEASEKLKSPAEESVRMRGLSTWSITLVDLDSLV